MRPEATASALPPGPLLVHSDVLRVGRMVEPTTDRAVLLGRHVEVLRGLAAGRDLWLPAFNYDFTRGADFEVERSPSQVGALSEHFRRHEASWRTAVPVFSFSGSGALPHHGHGAHVDPFDQGSLFAELARRDGSVVFYGAPFRSATLIHHAERLAGGPLYRFDKIFRGAVVEAGEPPRQVELVYHVRPLDRHLDYDWPRLMGDLRVDGVVHDLAGPEVLGLTARSWLEHWRERLSDDPLYLIDAASREWVAPLLERLGRRFELTDFEEAP